VEPTSEVRNASPRVSPDLRAPCASHCLALQPSLDRFSGPEGTTATNSGGSMLVCFELFAFSLHKANESLVTLMVRRTQAKEEGGTGEGDLYASSTRIPVLR
jgi:hypothetical protein